MLIHLFGINFLILFFKQFFFFSNQALFHNSQQKKKILRYILELFIYKKIFHFFYFRSPETCHPLLQWRRSFAEIVSQPTFFSLTLDKIVRYCI